MSVVPTNKLPSDVIRILSVAPVPNTKLFTAVTPKSVELALAIIQSALLIYPKSEPLRFHLAPTSPTPPLSNLNSAVLVDE